MPVKSYVQQAASSLHQAVMGIQSDESEMVRRYEHDIQHLKDEANSLENKRNLMAINMAQKDDPAQTTIVRNQVMNLEKEKQEKEAQIEHKERELAEQRQTLRQIKSELEGLTSNVQSALGRSGLV